MPDLAVLLINHNTREALRRCLDSLRHLPADLEVETVVADNASTDGSREMVPDEFPDAHMLALENRGYSHAVNRAAEATTSPRLLLLNADIVLEPGAVEALRAALDAQPRVGIAGARQVGPEGHAQLTCGAFPTVTGELARRRRQARMDAGETSALRKFEREYGKTSVVDWVSGSCMLLRREAFEAAGGWDENYFLFFEDIDFCHATGKAGYQVLYVPAAVVRHEHGASARQFSERAEVAYRGSQCYFARKHFGAGGLLLTRLYLTAKAATRALRGTGGVPARQMLAAAWAQVPAPRGGKTL